MSGKQGLKNTKKKKKTGSKEGRVLISRRSIVKRTASYATHFFSQLHIAIPNFSAVTSH